MYSLAVVEPGKVEIVELPEPKIGSYQVKIRNKMAALCNATDRKIIEGHFQGLDRYPLLLGHESVGIVVETGDKVRYIQAGDRVIGGLVLQPPGRDFASGWGGFSQFIMATDHRAMIEDGVADAEHGWVEVNEVQRAIPEDIPLEAAVCLCTWREVFGGFDDFGLKRGDRIVVFGAGPVGLSFVKFGKLLGLEFIGVVDPLPEKRKKAEQMGADQTFSFDEKELRSLPEMLGQKVDAVIDAVGKPEIINRGLPWLKMSGAICVYGVIDAPAITIEKQNAPFNFNVLIHQWPTRFREAAAQEPLLEWIKEEKLSYRDFVTAVYPFEKCSEAIELALSGDALKVLLRFEGE